MSLLEVADLQAGYGPVRVLEGLSFDVAEGQTAVILGANGAGKTTTLRALSGMVANKGRITFAGADITNATPDAIVRRGVAHVPQGRGTFVQQTVDENLRLGAYTRRDSGVRADTERMYALFPRLGERRGQAAGSLSGGEQQMLAIARALMLRPKLLLLDEPSLGLAPIVVQELFRTLVDLKKETGLTMLLVEQNANLALDVADQAYVLETGSIVFGGRADEVRADESVRRAYLGY
ncbi:MAG TPA: ABC transporter ATP-binding protein [Acidimicrobiales bacterium]|nr:ABC transporter ATP-binding protein [Acidimicrobiales bacterium]